MTSLNSSLFSLFFFFNDTATTEIYTLSLHDALPILTMQKTFFPISTAHPPLSRRRDPIAHGQSERSEEHTSELQSRQYLVCRLLLEKKKENLLGVNGYYRAAVMVWNEIESTKLEHFE